MTASAPGHRHRSTRCRARRHRLVTAGRRKSSKWAFSRGGDRLPPGGPPPAQSGDEGNQHIRPILTRGGVQGSLHVASEETTTASSRMIVHNAKNQKGVLYRYFICIGRKQRTTNCDIKAILIDVVEDKVDDLYRPITLSPTDRQRVETAVTAASRGHKQRKPRAPQEPEAEERPTATRTPAPSPSPLRRCNPRRPPTHRAGPHHQNTGPA